METWRKLNYTLPSGKRQFEKTTCCMTSTWLIVYMTFWKSTNFGQSKNIMVVMSQKRGQGDSAQGTSRLMKLFYDIMILWGYMSFQIYENPQNVHRVNPNVKTMGFK